MHAVNTGLCGQGSTIHANSEASLLKIHHSRHDSAAASIMVSEFYMHNCVSWDLKNVIYPIFELINMCNE